MPPITLSFSVPSSLSSPSVPISSVLSPSELSQSFPRFNCCIVAKGAEEPSEVRVRWWMVSPHSDIYLCDALVPWLGGVRGTVKVAVNARWGENKARSAREKTFLSSLWRKNADVLKFGTRDFGQVSRKKTLKRFFSRKNADIKFGKPNCCSKRVSFCVSHLR